MIPKTRLDEMFAQIRSNTDWDVDAEMLWGYFFTNEDRKALQTVADLLAVDGYRIVEIRPDEQNDYFWLHVEKVETHSSETLHERNQTFYRLADKYGLRSYDGMDVGPVKNDDREA